MELMHEVLQVCTYIPSLHWHCEIPSLTILFQESATVKQTFSSAREPIVWPFVIDTVYSAV